MTTTADQLAEIAQRLAELDSIETPAPIRTAIAESLRARMFTLPRGVTLTTRDDGGVIYVEAKRDHRGERLDRVELTVYGIVTRQGRESSGSVTVTHYPTHWHEGDEYAPRTRGWWRTLTGAAVPDGARENVAAAVLAECDYTPEQWEALAEETERAVRLAAIRSDVSAAHRHITDACVKLARFERTTEYGDAI